MLKRYLEAVKQFEAIILLFHNHKQFVTKSFMNDQMVKQVEKTLHVLAIALVFYPTEVDESIYKMLKESNPRFK